MLNHEGSHSEYFEELCALAASGQISEPEFVELQDHMKHCAGCRSAYADFIDLLHNKLPLADPELTGSFNPRGFFSENSSYRERFLAPFVDPEHPVRWAWTQHGRRRATHLQRIADPRWRELSVVRLRSPRETREWLTGLADV